MALLALPCPVLPSPLAGIVLRESFNRNTGGALLASGICDAVSAGVLIYVVSEWEWLGGQAGPPSGG